MFCNIEILKIKRKEILLLRKVANKVKGVISKTEMPLFIENSIVFGCNGIFMNHLFHLVEK